ncbi:MAG: hypothetical protein A2Y12_04390 [Planctomycetes bacterium GWF2_42_9]|nr:MAG: hypothetical protein A2Y12_04390 [Planctomycetes bacterium GWF2_42_9]
MITEQITIFVSIKAKKEKKQEVQRILNDLANSTHQEPGNINYILHISAQDDSLFMIYENWKDQAALDNHMNQPYLKDFIAKQSDLLEKPIEGKICKILQ